MINMWNSLPNDMAQANTTNQFKNKVDKFLENPEIAYINLAKIGSWSKVSGHKL